MARADFFLAMVQHDGLMDPNDLAKLSNCQLILSYRIALLAQHIEQMSCLGVMGLEAGLQR